MASTASLNNGQILADHYRIEHVLGAGGVGFTYKATDARLGTVVAVKELCPPSLAVRDETGAIGPGSPSLAASLDLVRAAFLRDARSIAALDDPSLPRVLDILEENGTVYTVMRYVDGRPLKDWLSVLGRPPTQSEIDRILADLLRALELMHGQGILHRDISTSSILVTDDGRAVLVDFGAARQILSAASGSLGAIVKQGFAPPEAYAVDARTQGPWTDIYALGATLFEAVTGRPPPDATERMLEDIKMPSAAAAAADYRPDFLAAIDRALALRPGDRPQSIVELRQILLPAPSPGAAAGATGATPAGGSSSPASAVPSLRRRDTSTAGQAPVASQPGGLGGLGDLLARLFRRDRPADRDTAPAEKKTDGGGGSGGLVQCTVFAPPLAEPGASVLVQVFLHPPPETARVETIAKAFDEATAKRQTAMLAAPIAIGQRVDIGILSSELSIDEAHQHVIWRGTADAANFLVTLPPGVAARDFFPIVVISIDGVPYGRLRFKLTCAPARLRATTTRAASVGLVGTPYRRAFCSYSSKDVIEVTRAVQVLSLLGLSCFHDKSSLRPGEAFADALREEVEQADLFLLFWSSSARRSEWVRKEAEWALAAQKGNAGAPDILPVILEGPPPAPPFEFLSDRHFDDRYQYMIAALHARPMP